MVITLIVSDWADHSAARWPTSVHSAAGINWSDLCQKYEPIFVCCFVLKGVELAHGTRIMHIYILGVLFCTTALKAL